MNDTVETASPELADYIGTKHIKAYPLARGNYCAYRGWDVPDDENPDDEGYFVVYPDGYESWSPKATFEASYRYTGEMTFGEAMLALEQGLKVARAGWNGKDMFLYYVQGSEFAVNRAPLLGIYPEGTLISYRPHIDMKTAQGDCVPWVASQTDLTASDWVLVE